ncbi:hypothetical protein KFU94_23110 [Chloroflexi bacterium TSY]|nr:hypothetical protein [Chloroflexi bacterium TSY]
MSILQIRHTFWILVLAIWLVVSGMALPVLLDEFVSTTQVMPALADDHQWGGSGGG